MELDSTTSAMATVLPWQMQQWSRVQAQKAGDSLPHALLVTGVEGIGKASFCRAMAQWLLCEAGEDIACGSCRNCQLNKAQTHPDLVFVNPEEKSTVIKIEQIRQLVDYINKTPQLARHKVICLGPAERMNTNAANALLKSLEEPSASTLILLYCHRPSALPATIRSRCQLLEMPFPQQQQAEQWLLPRLGSIEHVENALNIANGRPVRAMELFNAGLLDQYADFGARLDALAVNAISGVTLAAELKDIKLEDILMVLEAYLHRKYRQSWRQNDSARGGLKSLFLLIDEIQATRNAVQNGANPNRQLTLEKIFSGVQGLQATAAI